MHITVNGQVKELEVTTLMQLVEHYGLKKEHVIAEVNGQIIDRSKWDVYPLEEGSNVELVHFVGGG